VATASPWQPSLLVVGLNAPGRSAARRDVTVGVTAPSPIDGTAPSPIDGTAVVVLIDGSLAPQPRTKLLTVAAAAFVHHGDAGSGPPPQRGEHPHTQRERDDDREKQGHHGRDGDSDQIPETHDHRRDGSHQRKPRCGIGENVDEQA
jgi:hypothetical protein